jgi:hypothetical protein
MPLFVIRYVRRRAAKPSEKHGTSLIECRDQEAAIIFADVYMRGVNTYEHPGSRWTDNFQITAVERVWAR